PDLCRRNAVERRQSESRVRENCKHGLTRGRWGDDVKPETYSTEPSTFAQPKSNLALVRNRHV
ncbi:hypothetical protein, partial [Candidatus Fukatsuia symbiotica]|uniref:hypothetical protein n=1 Tax=Candidatus Fukatsuia symbiotica TaxID=1878942 RepID=UPI001C200225